MISLQLLGGAVLEGDTGPITGPASQRRRVALLALLATSPAGRVSRDKVIAYFWPEEDRERARHFLADSVFILRKHLGKESILTVGDDLVLNAEAAACDARAFKEAVAAGEMERAVELYRGPFLDGFFVSDAPEFEHWVERERGKLAQLQADALEKLAKDAETTGSPERAVEWWKRLAAHEPLSSRVAMRLMESLATTGNRGAALMHARVHAALLREVLDTDPDPEVESLAARISTQRETERIPPHGTPPATAAGATPAPIATREVGSELPRVGHPQGPFAAHDGEQVAPLSYPIPGDAGARRVRSSARRILAPVTLVLIAFIAVAVWARDRAATPASPVDAASRTSIAVLPFRVSGSPGYAYLGEGLVTLFSNELDVAGLLRPVDPYLLLSRREELAGSEPLSVSQEQELIRFLGAQLFLKGEVLESGGILRFVATLYRAGDRQGDPPSAMLQLSAEGTDLFRLVNTLSRQILVGQLRAPGDRLSQTAVRTTSSTVALKSYLEGEQAFRASDYVRAADSFREAVQTDPSFALAHYRLSMAAEWSFGFGEARVEAEKAVQSAEMLSPRHQGLVRAWYYFITGEADQAEALYQRLLSDDPRDVEAWSGIGEVRAHYNPVRGRSIDEAIYAFERVLELAPSYGEVRFHMLEFAARDGEMAQFDSLLAGVDPESPQRLSWEVARAAAWGSEMDKAAVARRLAGADEVVIGIAVARTGVHFRNLAAARNLASILTQSQRPTGWRAAGHIMAAQTLLARGEDDLAASQLQAAATMAPAWSLEMRALAVLLPESAPSPDRLRQLRDELEVWDPGRTTSELTFFFATHAFVHDQLRLYLLALISVRLGDNEQGAAYARRLAVAGGTMEERALARSLARSAEANLARARGDPAAALAFLERNDFTPPLEYIAVSPFFAGSLDRYLRAELLRELNRPAEAQPWYVSLSDGPDILFWGVATRRREELANMR